MVTVIGNLKGGAGKSTVAFNMAVGLAMSGRNVATFDLDPQMTLTDVIRIRNDEGYEPSFPVYHPDSQLGDRISSHNGEVLVDVGSANISGMKTALSRADRVLVPVPPSQADVWSTQRFMKIIREACPDRAPEIMIFINRADTHRAVRETDETAEALRTLPGTTFLPYRLGQRTAFRRSFSEGLAVFELEPRGKAATEMLALASALYGRK